MAVDMNKKVNETYVAHIGSTVACIGTKKQCEKFVEDLKYLNSYEVHTVEDYGFECYSEGTDDGYQNGYDSASMD